MIPLSHKTIPAQHLNQHQKMDFIDKLIPAQHRAGIFYAQS